MDILLLNTRSALEAWQRGFANGAHALGNPRDVSCIGDSRQLAALSAGVPLLSTPITIAADKPERRCQSRNWVSHVWSRGFPPASIVKLNDMGVCACAPWFCFLQMAAKLSLPDGIRLGMELCGSHSTLPFAPGIERAYRLTEMEERSGFTSASPVLTANELRRHLKAAPAASYSKALQAARFVADGSRSPGESRLFILLCLPVRLGGYGLPRPILNARIDLPERIRAIARARQFICDFYYPEKQLAIEYDGGYHWQGAQRMSDNTRQLVLEELGLRIIRIDARQLASPEALDLQARRIAEHLGIRLRQPSETSLQKRRLLRRQALDYRVNVYA